MKGIVDTSFLSPIVRLSLLSFSGHLLMSVNWLLLKLWFIVGDGLYFCFGGRGQLMVKIFVCRDLLLAATSKLLVIVRGFVEQLIARVQSGTFIELRRFHAPVALCQVVHLYAFDVNASITKNDCIHTRFCVCGNILLFCDSKHHVALYLNTRRLLEQ